MDKYDKNKITEIIKNYQEDKVVFEKITTLKRCMHILSIIIIGMGFLLFIWYDEKYHFLKSHTFFIDAIIFTIVLILLYKYYNYTLKKLYSVNTKLSRFLLKRTKKSLHTSIEDAEINLYDGYYIINECTVEKILKTPKYMLLDGSVTEEEYAYFLVVFHSYTKEKHMIPITKEDYDKFGNAKNRGTLMIISEEDYDNNVIENIETYLTN